MEALKTVWNFIQDEVLGMNWLDRLLATILNAVGLDTTGKIGSSIHFFIYDTIKIMVLLGVVILIISYIQSYFPPERTKKIRSLYSRPKTTPKCAFPTRITIMIRWQRSTFLSAHTTGTNALVLPFCATICSNICTFMT